MPARISHKVASQVSTVLHTVFRAATASRPLAIAPRNGYVLLLFFDGGSRGNPGPGGSGSVGRIFCGSYTGRVNIRSIDLPTTFQHEFRVGQGFRSEWLTWTRPREKVSSWYRLHQKPHLLSATPTFQETSPVSRATFWYQLTSPASCCGNFNGNLRSSLMSSLRLPFRLLVVTRASIYSFECRCYQKQLHPLAKISES